jgi:VanZ family protein
MSTPTLPLGRRRTLGPRPHISRFGPRHCAAWLVLYALLVVYGSLVLGPLGFHFVPQDPSAVWDRFLATPFFETGSDQRPDWIANMLMMVPFGLLATGTFGAGRSLNARVAGGAAALLLGFAFVLAVKYAQLFFPPRTVSLNYIVAQSVGVTIGVALFHPVRMAVWRVAAVTDEPTRFRLLLDVAIAGFVAFALFPFDIALSHGDFAHRFATLPGALLSLPGGDRPLGVQLAVLVATVVAAMPLGMRLALQAERPGLGQIVANGAALLLVLFGATLFVLSARVSVLTFVLRVAGVVAGALLLRWLSVSDITRIRYRIGRALPVLVPVYLLLLVYANGLLTRSWLTPEQALAGLDPRGLLPFWHDYIVSKAHALQSDVVHIAMYAPIGVMLWLRRGGSLRSNIAAATFGGLLSLAIELGRWLKPGLAPDFNEVLLGAAAAAVANRIMPVLWPTLLSISPLVTRADTADGAGTRVAVVEIPTAAWLPARLMVSTVLILLAAVLAWEYPLGGVLALVALAVWVAVLWVWPVMWLLLLPAILPALDLAPWTGWIAITEADIAVLAAVAVLLLRVPPARQDLWPDDRVRLFPRFVLALSLVACLIGVVRGITMTPLFPGGSDNPYLTWLNTLRLAKPYLSAIALLPFLRARQREHGDAIRLFGVGILIGLVLVGLAALAERTAFKSLSDIHSDFRITATFSSMHVGGGHIGVYLAFAMPFLLLCLRRPRLWTLVSLVAVLLLSSYTLVVTFARTGYAATLVSMLTACTGWTYAFRRRRRATDSVSGVLVAAVVVVALVAGLNTSFMRWRVARVWPDLVTREANWGAGLDRRNNDFMAWLFGMGTGAYPRFAALRSPPDEQPGNFVVKYDGPQRYLATEFGPDFYFGQKVQVAHGATYTMRFGMRAESPDTQLKVHLCSKLLLYSAGCHILILAPAESATWQQVSESLPAPEQRGALPTPVELAFSSGPGMKIDIADIQLIGPDGRNVVINGDFAAGTARWFFTSDYHRLWRILDSPLSVWFEGGIVGIVALSLLVVSGLGGALNAIHRGDPLGAPIAGAMVGILFCGMFDNVFEAPRIALLFDLVAMQGLMLGWPPRTSLPEEEDEPPPAPWWIVYRPGSRSAGRSAAPMSPSQ